MTYYNTTQETDESLKQCRRVANKQEKEVLTAYKQQNALLNSPCAPSEIHAMLSKYPITSIRRAITDLTKKGYLRKTGVKIVGPYSRREHCWELIHSEGEDAR